MAALRELLVKFGVDVDQSKLDRADKGVQGLASSAKKLAAVFAASMIVGRVRAFVSEMVTVGTTLSDTSARLGVSADALQRLDVAAQLVGASFGDVSSSLQKLSRTATAAKDGSAGMGDAFRRLGVSVKDSEGRLKSADVLFREVGLGIAAIRDPAERTALAIRTLGPAGAKLAPMFANGAAGVDKMLGKLDELGGGLSRDAIGQLAKTAELTVEYNFALRSLKSTIVTMIMPAINGLVGYLSKAFATIAKVEKSTNIAKAAMVVFGAAAVKAALAARAAWLPNLLMFAKAALPIAAIVLLVDELLTLFDGGDTIIGGFIDSMFGIGATEKVVKELRDAWKHFFVEVFDNETRTAGEKWELFVIRLGKPIGRFLTEELPEFFRYLKKDFDAFMVQLGYDLVEAWGYLKKDVGGFFSELPGQFAQLGKDIIAGLLNGLRFGAGEVKDFFVGLGKDSLKAIKGIFRSNSPSKATEEVGVGLPEGLAIGIAKGAKEVDAQINRTFTLEGFAPRVRVPDSGRALAPSGPRSVDQRNNITINVQGSGNTRQDVREGVSLGLSDGLDGLRAALEVTA